MAGQLRELTIEEAKKSPASFMYVWASDKFLAAIPRRHARVIFMKRAHQKKILMLSADKYLGDQNKVNEYYSAIETAFYNTYGMSPYQALITLAQGGTVAGKNWEKGIYGIGEVKVNTFYGSNLTVDKNTGDILSGGTVVSDNKKTVYANLSKKNVGAYQKFYTDGNGKTYMSQYDKKTKSYYAYSVSNSDGSIYSAADGKSMTQADSADLWGNIQMLLQKVMDWFLELFAKDEKTKEPMTVENTVPNQTGDGFSYVPGEEPLLGSASALLLLAAGAGLILSGGVLGGKKKKK